jgi:hypothetical protein
MDNINLGIGTMSNNLSDAISKVYNARYRSGAQSALGVANLIERQEQGNAANQIAAANIPINKLNAESLAREAEPLGLTSPTTTPTNAKSILDKYNEAHSLFFK